MLDVKPFVLSVKALIHDENGRYLAIRRSKASRNNAGQWDFPGGKIDAGETFDVALIREVAEETGLSVCLESVLGAGESELPDRTVAYIFMQARIVGGEVCISDEHEAFEWMTPEALANADLCPQFRKLAQSLIST